MYSAISKISCNINTFIFYLYYNTVPTQTTFHVHLLKSCYFDTKQTLFCTDLVAKLQIFFTEEKQRKNISTCLKIIITRTKNLQHKECNNPTYSQLHVPNVVTPLIGHEGYIWTT